MFGWGRKSAPEVETKDADLSAPDAWLLSLFGALPVDLSEGINADVALTMPAVASAVRVMSESAASLTARVEMTVDGKWKPAPDHSVQELIDVEVNEWTSWPQLVRDLVAAAQIDDRGGMAWVNRVGGGKPQEIIFYQRGAITVSTKITGEVEYKLDNKRLKASDIIHLQAPFSRSPLSLAREAIRTGLLMERHQSRFFANGARPGGVLESPKPVGDEAVKRMLRGWAAAHAGPDKAGNTPLLWDGTTYRPLTMNSTDAQFLELRKFTILEVARAFRVPPTMLFDYERATWANSEQAGKEFLTYSLEPWLQSLEAALRRALFSEEERKTHRITFERDDLTRADLGERATAYSSLISARVINPNEARKWEGLEPYPGGEEFANPNTGANQPGAAAPQPANDQRRAA